MRRRICIPLLLLLCTSTVSAASISCQQTLLDSDTNTDWILSLDEYKMFCQKEAEKTPILSLELLPEVLANIYIEQSDPVLGEINLQGLKKDCSDPVLKARAEDVCVKTNQVLAKMVEQALAATSDTATRQGPFVGEALAKDGLLHQTNKQEEEEDADDMDDVDLDNVCLPQERALTVCVGTNNCQACEDLLTEEPKEPDLFSDATALPDYTTIVASMNEYLGDQCHYTQDSICTLQECCSSCTQELDAMYACVLQAGKEAIESSLLELESLLGQYENATREGDADTGSVELVFECDLTALECDDRVETPEEEEETDSATAEEEDCDPQALEADLKACVDVNECHSCQEQLGEPPEEGLDDNPGDYNSIVTNANQYFSDMCYYTQDSICSLQECCSNCAEQIQASYSCSVQYSMKRAASGVELVLDTIPRPDEAEELDWQCDWTATTADSPCGTNNTVGDGPFTEPIEPGGETTEQSTTGGEQESGTFTTAFIISNLRGLNAEAVNEGEGLLEQLTKALEDALTSEEFGAEIARIASEGIPDHAGTEEPERGNSGVAGGPPPPPPGGAEAGPSEDADTPDSEGSDSGIAGGPPPPVIAGGPPPPPPGGRRRTLARRSENVMTRSLQESDLEVALATVEFDNVQVLNVQDTDCLTTTDRNANCQVAFATYSMEYPEEFSLVDMNYLSGTGLARWIEQGKLQESLPEDSPFTVEAAANPDDYEMDGQSDADEPPTSDDPGDGAADGGPARQQITVKYYVSNEDNIQDPLEVNASGLSASWPAFSREVVANITSARNRRRLHKGLRRLVVDMEPESASVSSILQVDCPDGAKQGTTCHNVTSSYVLLLRGDEDPAAVELEYGRGTINAVNNGNYQAVLDREDPDSPLTIGIIPESDKGNADPDSGGNETTSEDPDDGGNDMDEMPDSETLELPIPTVQPVLVNSSFLMSSPEGKTAEELKASPDSEELKTLKTAYMGFVEETVVGLGAEKTSNDEGPSDDGSARQRYLRFQNDGLMKSFDRVRGRRLSVNYDSDSPEIYDFKDTPCSEPASVSKQATEEDGKPCITVFGKYRIVVDPEEDAEEIYKTYVEATKISILDGKLEEYLQATATAMNVPAPFVIEGVSPVVDNGFNAFAESEAPAETDSVSDGEETPAPTTLAPNATELNESAAIGRCSPVARTVTAVLGVAISLLNYW